MHIYVFRGSFSISRVILKQVAETGGFSSDFSCSDRRNDGSWQLESLENRWHDSKKTI